jgi:hypothetical protein
MAKMRGGEGVARVLNEIGTNIKRASTLQVGILAGSTYPDGTPVALIAAINEFGAPSRGQPPRPAIRNMIATKSPEWGPAIGRLMVENNYDMQVTFQLAGEAIAGQWRQSIIDLWDPPLAESTIERKGFSKPLIDRSIMLQSVDYRVSKG